jgi:hypothetical protein
MVGGCPPHSQEVRKKKEEETRVPSAFQGEGVSSMI